MTLNQNFPGARSTVRSRLEGTDRGLDALVGLVILLAELLVGFVSFAALVDFGDASLATNPSASDSLEFGLGFAVVASGIAVVITTLVYLVRIAVGRRSWGAPLWGLILMTIALIVGYGIMASGL